jgi:hypothetical protein
VRLADVRDLVLRGGHLSDRAVVDVCMTGERPAHLDRCDICAARAIDVGRWLDEVRAIGEADVDAVYPAERLAAQQAQIMRRLEQIDQPARVINFPRNMRLDGPADQGRRVSPGWVAVAAAAGLVLGVVGTQVSSHYLAPRPAATMTAQAVSPSAPTPINLDPEGVARVTAADQEVMGRPHVEGLDAIDQITPSMLSESEQRSLTLAALKTGTGGSIK